MRFCFFQLFLLAAWLLPDTGQCQGWLDPPAYRWSAGLSLSANTLPIRYNLGGREIDNSGPFGIAGAYRLTHRLTVQASLVGDRDVQHRRAIYTTYQQTTVVVEDGTDVRTGFSLPLLGRYTLTRRPHRVQFDAMAGITYLYRQLHEETTYTDTLQNVTHFSSSQTASNFYLTLGLGARCALGKHLELVADYRLNNPLRAGTRVTWETLSFFDGYVLGVHYRFRRQ